MKKSFGYNGKLKLFLYIFLFSQNCYCQQSGNYDSLIEKYSKQFGIDKNLVKSIIRVSSGNNPKVVSQSGAVGLMQLTPDVIKYMGVQNPTDPGDNIRGGCKYFKNLLDQFGDEELAIAAFNVGPTAVKKYGKVPPFPEVKRFVTEVKKVYETLENTSIDSNVYGNWSGTAKYLRYEMNPQFENMKSVVGQTQPFDLEINPDGSGVSIKSFGKLLGNPSLYKTELDKNNLRIEYNGPNPFGEQIPNTTTTHTMSYILDLHISNGTMKGEFDAKFFTKTVFNIPGMNLPESNTEIKYLMQLNLKKN